MKLTNAERRLLREAKKWEGEGCGIHHAGNGARSAALHRMERKGLLRSEGFGPDANDSDREYPLWVLAPAGYDALNAMELTHPSIDDTIAYATALHAGQRDKAGVPYIAHPLSVMRRVPEEMWHVAVLHDAKEDCGITDEDLRGKGYGENEIVVIDLLTRRHGEEYRTFIERIATSDNLAAITVKIADLDDNLEEGRGWQMPPSQFSRYVDARSRLQMVKEGR